MVLAFAGLALSTSASYSAWADQFSSGAQTSKSSRDTPIANYLDLEQAALTLRQEKKFDQAIITYGKALNALAVNAKQDRASMYFGRGISYDLANHPVDAVRDYQLSLKLFEEYIQQNPTADDVGQCARAVQNLKDQLGLKEREEAPESSYLKLIAQRKWPQKKQPLHLYIESDPATGFDSKLTNMITHAFTEWTSAVGSELRFIPTSDRRNAEVIVTRFSSPYDLENIGQTTFDYKKDDAGNDELTTAQVRLNCVSSEASELSAHAMESFASTSLQLSGRALGVDGYSPNGADAMYWKSSRTTLSERDKTTIRQLYE